MIGTNISEMSGLSKLIVKRCIRFIAFYRRIYWLLIIILWVTGLSAQEDSCLLYLNEAARLLEEKADFPGVLEIVPEKCARRLLRKSDTKVRAGELLMLASDKLGNDAEAQRYTGYILRADPYYPLESGTPELLARSREFKVRGLALGFTGGFNTNLVTILDRQTTDSLRIQEENYGLIRNIHTGVFVSFRPDMYRPLEYRLEYRFVPRQYRYEVEYEVLPPDGSPERATVSYEERLATGNFDFQLRYYFGAPKILPTGRLSGFVYAGAAAVHLQRSRLENLRIVYTDDRTRDDDEGAVVITPCVEGDDLRKIWNGAAFLGGGVQFRISPGLVLSAEGRYDMLFNITDQSGSGICSDIQERFFYLNHDRMIHSLYLSGGIAYYFFLPKQRRR